MYNHSCRVKQTGNIPIRLGMTEGVKLSGAARGEDCLRMTLWRIPGIRVPKVQGCVSG